MQVASLLLSDECKLFCFLSQLTVLFSLPISSGEVLCNGVQCCLEFHSGPYPHLRAHELTVNSEQAS